MRVVLQIGLLLVLIGISAVVLPHALMAQSTGDVAAHRAQLQSQLDALETQIKQTQANLDTLHGQHSSLQRDIDILDGQIQQAKLQVQATAIAIQQLTGNIGMHNQAIGTLSGKMGQEQQSLAQIIRKTDEIDSYSLVEVALSSDDVSRFFGDVDSFVAIKQGLGVSFAALTSTKTQKITEKTALETQRGEQQRLEQLQVSEQQQVQAKEAQKQQLLSATKGLETNYQKLYNTQQKSAAQIRAELFALAGGGGQIPLPTAIALAKQAGAATGVRAAVILGILKQETNLGKNLGNGTWQVDMHPTRDVPVFKVIMDTLGMNPDTVKISRAPSYGYGGAMGPGQFIPSTWACYAGYVNSTTGACGKGTDGTYAGPWQYTASKDRIAKLAGHPSVPSNPYNNLDAFTATALLMADNGAAAGTLSAERTAALRYFAGWGNAGNPAYAFYGDGVMGFAAEFQQEIDTLSGK